MQGTAMHTRWMQRRIEIAICKIEDGGSCCRGTMQAIDAMAECFEFTAQAKPFESCQA
jgi:hypothetical protein